MKVIGEKGRIGGKVRRKAESHRRERQDRRKGEKKG